MWKTNWKKVNVTKASNPTRDKDFAEIFHEDLCFLSGNTSIAPKKHEKLTFDSYQYFSTFSVDVNVNSFLAN